MIRKYNLLKKGLLRKEKIFFVKFIIKGAEIRQKKINIYNKINDILLFKFDKEKFIKKSFALKWKRISRTIALDKTVRSIQRRFIIYLRKMKFQKKFNFLKTFNLITMQKIRLNKTRSVRKERYWVRYNAQIFQTTLRSSDNKQQFSNLAIGRFDLNLFI